MLEIAWKMWKKESEVSRTGPASEREHTAKPEDPPELKFREVKILIQCLLGNNNRIGNLGFLLRKSRDLFTTLKLPCEMQERENK